MMKKPLRLLTAVFLVMVPPLFAAEEPVPFIPYSLADQHGTPHRLQPETRTVIMSFEMKQAKSIHSWLAAKDPEYLKSHAAEYVVDISPMPGLITKLFAGPKMRKYKFPIIQADDKGFADTYPHREGKISVFSLDPSQESATVQYVAGPSEIEALLESGAESESDDAAETAAE